MTINLKNLQKRCLLTTKNLQKKKCPKNEKKVQSQFFQEKNGF